MRTNKQQTNNKHTNVTFLLSGRVTQSTGSRIYLFDGLVFPIVQPNGQVYAHEVHKHLPEDLNVPEDLSSSDQNSNSESVMPELTESSEDEFDIRANGSSEDEFDIRANGLRFPFATFLSVHEYVQRTEFQARGACHVHGYWQ